MSGMISVQPRETFVHMVLMSFQTPQAVASATDFASPNFVSLLTTCKTVHFCSVIKSTEKVGLKVHLLLGMATRDLCGAAACL